MSNNQLQEAAKAYAEEAFYQPADIEIGERTFLAGAAFQNEMLAGELNELREWKRQALEVMPDFQAIGKVLGIGVGETVHDKIVPGIESLMAQKKGLKGLLADAHSWGWVDGSLNDDLSEEESLANFKTEHNL